jgi:acetyltransferase-like isoleucine patch superfamily enzyme
MKKFFIRIKNKIRYEISKRLRPEMISFSNWNGKPIKNTIISNTSHISNRSNIQIGDNVFIFHNTYIDGHKKIILADGVAIGHCSTLVTHSAHHAIRLYGFDYIQTNPQKMKGLLTGEILIGEFSFIGPHCVLMPGTKIGKGCIVAAFSFVTGDFPDYSIIKGNPAVVVGNTKDIDKQFLRRYPGLNNSYFD